MQLSEIKKRIDEILTIESILAVKKRNNYLENGDDNKILLCHGFLIGIINVSESLESLFKELKDEIKTP